MGDTYHRARISILTELLSFPIIRGKDWTDDRKPDPGSLVATSGAPETKWYLSWVVETELHEGGWHRYLLRSVEDGELSWWENVWLFRYSQERVQARPDWRWTDKQFDFRDRWHKVCYKQHDAYMVLPCRPTFHDNGSVTLSLRERHGGFRDHYKFHHERTFDSWRKTTMKMMSEFYLEGCAESKKLSEKIRKAREAKEISA